MALVGGELPITTKAPSSAQVARGRNGRVGFLLNSPRTPPLVRIQSL